MCRPYSYTRKYTTVYECITGVLKSKCALIITNLMEENTMGVWGIGIYANDIAEDVRDACNDIYAIYDVAEGNELLFNHFADVLNQGYIDNEYASFWYALADWQWKHGMLNEFVKRKTLELLDNYAGIEEWIEFGNNVDIRKKRNVMEALKERLVSNQGVFKKPRLILAKPKHKIGDVIVFRATNYVDEFDSAWHITDLRPPFMFSDCRLNKSTYENIEGIDAHGKYMAILCVGTIKEAHSVYTPDVYDEYSLYVWYDYLDTQKPTGEKLSSCGFLPMLKWELRDFNKNITDSILWIYRFTLPDELFKPTCYIEDISKAINLGSEVTRFNNLSYAKKYSADYYRGDTIVSMYYTLFEEKTRMQLVDIAIDNLLNEKISNPKLLSPSEVDQAYKEYLKGLSE